MLTAIDCCFTAAADARKLQSYARALAWPQKKKN